MTTNCELSFLQLWVLCSSCPTVILLPQEQPPKAPHLSSGHSETFSQPSVFRPLLLSWPGPPLVKIVSVHARCGAFEQSGDKHIQSHVVFLPDQGFLLYLSQYLGCVWGGGAGGAVLLCQPSPAALLLLSHNWGRSLWVFFSQPHHHCVLPSHMLTIFPIISPSILSPDLDSQGVRFKARWTERFFSPMTVVLLTSHSRVPWETSGAEGLSFSEN